MSFHVVQNQLTLHGTYATPLVVASVVVASLASYVALVLASRVIAASGRLQQAWLIAGALALGIGIWAMHFVGMLAFRLDDRPIGYDVPRLVLSVLVAIAASGFALWVVSHRAGAWRWLPIAGIAMGAAIAGMHYLGMAGLHTTAALSWRPFLVLASIVIAVGASGTALALAAWFQSDESATTQVRRVIAAVVMGGAIAGMHYTAMAAARFHPLGPEAELAARVRVQTMGLIATPGLGVLVIVATMLILGVALAGSMMDRHLRRMDAEHTRTRESEAALRRSEARFRSLAEATAQVIWTRNAQGEFSVPQDEWTEYTGQPFEALKQWGWLDAIHPEDRDHLAASWRESVASGQLHVAEHRLRRHDGVFRWMAVRAAPVREPDGTIAEWMGIEVDVTARHEAEDRIRSIESQLLQAQKLEAVGRLAGGIAHDFNNLLTVISGTTSLARRRLPPSSPLAEELADVEQASERAAALTRQLLAFSRRQSLNPAVLEINDVIKRLDGLLRRTLGDDLELRMVLGPDAGRVRADPGQLEQVLLNLAVNARDAMPDGGTLTIETLRMTIESAYASTHLGVEAGPYVMLSVSDTGIGMDVLTCARVFEPFFTTKEVDKGTGLGLSTVYGIVKQSGGSIFVYSEPGHGATFKIYLPRVVEAATNLEPELIPAAPDAKGREVILLAEDAADVRRFTARVLREAGYQVLEAGNVEGGLLAAAAYQGRIHLVLTDVMMPHGTGRQLATQLRTLRPDIGVVYMSGYTDDTVLQRAVIEPGTAFIQKPFSPTLLLTQVRAVLEANPARAISRRA
ncbi:MAG TPA: MHYT domain-containing protein [Gemmatimonadales bacterium]|jgi:PAS domain S-box-containing protein